VDARVEVNGAPQVGEEALRFMKTIADIYIAGARTTNDWSHSTRSRGQPGGMGDGVHGVFSRAALSPIPTSWELRRSCLFRNKS
jgi:hypothetical protein